MTCTSRTIHSYYRVFHLVPSLCDSDVVRLRFGVKRFETNSSTASKIVVPPIMMRNEGWTDNLVQTAIILRREIRRQSNRNSARRSRLCRQAECARCAEVHARLQALRMENELLKESLRRLYEEWDKIAYSNILMKGELSKLAKPEKLPDLDVFLRSPFTEG
ncbi:hypothetical protein L6452_16716 [Arctium lappa]|uniref:Uncharacterized protein n=1 Tax=Arctium lappa TaxID=4217 RepID=A0ACB9C1L7_ARCLA|nr:hypothetical protein L6452_16716 [Arctium lappa]